MKTQFLLPLLFIPMLLRAETAEIKMLIDEGKRLEALSILGVKAEGEPETRVCFFDTPDAVLDQHRLILRIRLDTKAGNNGKKNADTIVKLRGAVQPPQGFETLKPEMDWTGPAASKPSYSIKAEDLAEAEMTQVLDGKLPLEKVLTAEQMGFVAACLNPAGDRKVKVPWTALVRYGVISAWKSKREVGEFSKVTVETWRLSREGKPLLELLEISVKIEAPTASEIAANAAAFYAAAEKKGLGKPTGASKTNRVSEYFKPGR